MYEIFSFYRLYLMLECAPIANKASFTASDATLKLRY